MFKKILCLLISALFLGIAPLHASEHSPFTEIFVEGDKELNGIFDLSIEYGSQSINAIQSNCFPSRIPLSSVRRKGDFHGQLSQWISCREVPDR